MEELDWILNCNSDINIFKISPRDTIVMGSIPDKFLVWFSSRFRVLGRSIGDGLQTTFGNFPLVFVSRCHANSVLPANVLPRHILARLVVPEV